MKAKRRNPADNRTINNNRLQSLFESVEKEFKLENFSTKYFSAESKIETSFVLVEVPNIVKLVTTLVLRDVGSEIKIETTTRLCTTHFHPIGLSHPNLIKLMSRHFSKLNGSFRFGFFGLDILAGNIFFRVNTSARTQNVCLNPQPIKTIIRINLTTAYFAVRFHIYKILFMINMISLKEASDIFKHIETRPNTQPYTYRKLNPEFVAHIRNIKTFSRDCKSNRLNWTNEQLNLLAFPTTSETASYKATIVTPIDLLKVDDIRSAVTSGGFGDLSLLRITYRIKGYSTGPITRQIIMKEEKSNSRSSGHQNPNGFELEEEENRLNNELLVLKHFQYRNSASQFVAKFYDADDQNKRELGLHSRAILMEFYPHKSLEHFRTKNNGLSINTKIWFLIQVAQGIRFLGQEGVYHLDIKGSNILIQKNYTLRLIDFGESYLKNPDPHLGLRQADYDKQFKPGRTFPYAAPELVFKPFKTSKLDDRTDLFSFGMMMGEMLFDNFLIDFKKSNFPALSQKYQTLTYKTKMSQISAELTGPKKLFKYLRILALLCLHPNPKERPSQEWIVIMLKESMHFLEKMY